MRTDYVLICLMLLAAFGYYQVQSMQAKFYPGVIAPSPPRQATTPDKSFTYGPYTVNPVAEFEITALVLSAKSYSWGEEAQLAPVDLALGWGPMSDGDILKDISITQSNRWYTFFYQKPPIAHSEIVAHSSNMHLIPATSSIKSLMLRVKKGDVVNFKGFLVDITKPDGWHWYSSRSRTDTGAGSCELVWVREFRVLGR